MPTTVERGNALRVDPEAAVDSGVAADPAGFSKDAQDFFTGGVGADGGSGAGAGDTAGRSGNAPESSEGATICSDVSRVGVAGVSAADSGTDTNCGVLTVSWPCAPAADREVFEELGEAGTVETSEISLDEGMVDSAGGGTSDAAAGATASSTAGRGTERVN